MLVRRKYLGESAILQEYVDYSSLISRAEVAGVQQEVILIDRMLLVNVFVLVYSANTTHFNVSLGNKL